MAWRYVYFDRDLHSDEIVQAISTIFNVEGKYIYLQNGELDLSIVDGDILVACGVEKLKGDFPTILGITPLRKNLIPVDAYATIGRLCTYLKSFALLTSASNNPYHWLLIRGENDYQLVKLNAEKLDNEQNFELGIEQYLHVWVNNTLGS
jgi:hypothetical protein